MFGVWLAGAILHEVAAQDTTIYLLSGQGSDERIFSGIAYDTSRYDIRYLSYLPIERGEDMASYARRMAAGVDTTAPFVLVGVSLGGMLCVEMNRFLHPERTYIISSAQCRKELPLRYRIQRYLPVYALVPGRVIRSGSVIVQGLVEPDRKLHKEIFIAMLRAKDPQFMKRSIRMIVSWDAPCLPAQSVVHLHGTNDHTLPVRRLEPDAVIEGGSHMMTLCRARDVQRFLAHDGWCPMPD